MHNFWPLVFLLLLPCTTNEAQIIDDFSNGFSQKWEGDRDDFIVDADNRLQLSASEAGNSILTQATTFSEIQTWTFFVDLDFAPSAANSLIILLAATDDLRNAYGLQIGESGSEDAWRLFERIDGENNLLARSTASFGEGFTGIVNVVNANNEWAISVEIDGESIMIIQHEGQFDPANYSKFGFRCIYTSTRADRFIFDDFLIQADMNIVDDTPPKLTSVVVDNDSILELTFSERLDANNVMAQNFMINDQTPRLVTLNASGRTANIVAAMPFLPNATNVLMITGLADPSANLLDTLIVFEFIPEIELRPFDILITELMIDPAPSVGLPEEEYIELYNATNITVDLSSIVLRWRDETISLPSITIAAGAYFILVDESHSALFEDFGIVVGIEGFPVLRNTFDRIELRQTDGGYLHSISYNLTWYQDLTRNDGGYSLAMKDISKPCYTEAGWGASPSFIGGSPGAENETMTPQDDLRLVSSSIDSNQLRLKYNRLIGTADQLEIQSLLGPMVEAVEINEPFDEVSVFFDASTSLEGEIVVDFNDCEGSTRHDTIALVAPQTPEPGDILINEVLFSGVLAALDYVELVNVSDKYLSLENVFIGNFFEGSRVESIVLDIILSPSSYLVLTENPTAVKTQFPVHEANAIFLQPLPSLNNDAGNVTLYTQSAGAELILDNFDYRADLHDPRLNSIAGVALERISLESPTQNDFNWYSAASTVSFGSPGLPNSQQSVQRASGNFVLRSEIFSPDGDGFEDLLIIDYSLGQADFLANIEVFNTRGVSVYKASNLLLGQEGFIHWDGRSENGDTLKLGRYLVRIEWFSPDGTVEDTILSCVLAY